MAIPDALPAWRQDQLGKAKTRKYGAEHYWGNTIKKRLSLQGNPAAKDDWYVNPKTKEPIIFLDFARSEDRFAKHFDRDGKPSQTLLYAMEDRLENWHVLQELAGLR